MSFIAFVAKRFNEDRCAQIASSLTYTTLLALVPLITITLTVIAAFPVFSDLTTELKVFILSNLVPDSAGKVITVYMQQFSENAAKLTALGILFLALTAFMLMLTIDRAFNSIWRVARPRPLVNRLLIYWAALTLGPVLVGGSLSLTSYLLSLSFGLVGHTRSDSILVLRLVPTVLTTLAFALLYYTVPNRYVPRSHALIGGLVAGLAFEAMKKLFAVYVTHFGSYKLVYGTFASFPIFLLWIYFSWVVILLGAVIAASLSHWRSGAWQVKRAASRRMYDALRILEVLYMAHQRGQPASLQELRRAVNMGFDDLEAILEVLRSANWTRRVAGNAWALIKDPERIRVSDVFRLFVLDPEQLISAAAEGDRLVALIREAAAGAEETLEKSLKDLYGRTA